MRPRLSRIALASVVAASAAIGLRGRWRRYEVRESSMEPRLSSGDYIIAAAQEGEIARGDLVIIPHPEVGGFELIKRIVGLPGEAIVLSNGYVHVDGIVLAEPWATGPTRPDGEWRLNNHEVFVLGDNRPASAADSRTIGPVDKDTIKWRVVARYWPPSSLGRLR